MKRSPKTRRRRILDVLALLLIMIVARRSRGQVADWSQEQAAPAWSLAIPRLRYAETDVEIEQDNYDSPGSGGHIHSNNYYISPRLGLEWKNYIYHPYLLNYSLLFEPSYVWQQRSQNETVNRSDDFRLNGVYAVNLLEVKPYATTASYSRSHDQIQYDLFDTATVDSQVWTATSGYREGPVPVTLTFSQSHEDSRDFNENLTTDQRTLDLNAHNQRDKEDLTELRYQLNEFDRDTRVPGASISSQSTYHHLSLMDTEHFQKGVLRSIFRFDEREASGLGSTDLNGNINYNVDHTPSLHTYYDYSLSRSTADGADTLQNYADAGLRHQLYESLSSGLEVHGSTLNGSSGDTSIDALSAGTSASADYNKRLSTWGHLTVGNSTSFNITEQEAQGAELLIANESYTVPMNGLIRLSQPREIAILSVTDANHNPLQLNLDYSIIQSTDPWQIQIITIGPAHVQPGSIILVTYTVRTNPSGSYYTVANQSMIRLSFWQDMAAVFARYGITDSHADSPQFILQNDVIVQFGAELTWKNLRLYGDYTDDRSTLYDTRGVNLAESYSLSVAADSTLRLDFSQNWSHNTYETDSGGRLSEDMTFYNFMLHHEWHPLVNFNWNAEIGYRQQRGLGLNEDLFAARTYLDWRLGKLELHVGYQHEFQNIITTSRDRDFGFVRIRRNF